MISEATKSYAQSSNACDRTPAKASSNFHLNPPTTPKRYNAVRDEADERQLIAGGKRHATVLHNS